MDRFSFLNTAHIELIDSMYQQYLQSPDSIEPSWKSFFQGFDFALANYGESVQEVPQVVQTGINTGAVPEDILTEFKVINLIEAYRTRGHLFTKTNPVRKRREYSPTLDIENFGLTKADLGKKFDCATQVGMAAPATLEDIIKHLEQVYCDSIGVEYIHIKNVEEKNFIRKWISEN